MSTSYATHESLGQAVFGHAELGDKRRTDRLVTTFDLMCRHPGGSLPDKLASPPALRAFYNLCSRSEVTHEAIIAAARQYTLSQIEACPGRVLIIHDATELDFTSKKSLADQLGQIGNGNNRGYICQNVLAVEAESGRVLGLLDQILHHRVEAPEKETLPEKRQRETRESLLWVTGTRHLPNSPKLIDVCDRGADTFEFLEHEFKSGRSFVIRACKTRKVHPGHTAEGPQQYLKDYAHSLPELGCFKMDVQEQQGRAARKDGKFAISGGPVLVYPPHAKAGIHGNDPLPLHVVQITEIDPPAGEEAIDWTLLTLHPVEEFDAAWLVTEDYEKRWIVEELHKGQKTGCGTEDMQFTTIDRLEPAIAVLTVVAITLLNLRDASRAPDAKTRPAKTILDETYVEALSDWRYREVKQMTVHEFYYALARLGGHQNRKSDHQPGWIVLWRGWTKLQLIHAGYVAGKRKRCGKT